MKKINCNKVFDKGKPVNDERLLIKANFRTQNKILRFFKWIGLNKLLPVYDLVDVKLTFQNIGTVDIKRGKDVSWCICYPSGSHQIRKWHLNIPELKRGEICEEKPEWLFQPEVPGHHTMMIARPVDKEIKQIDSLKYAGEYGLVGREYRLTDDSWKGSFYVLNRGEYINTLLVLGAIAIAIFSLLISIKQALFDTGAFSIIFNF